MTINLSQTLPALLHKFSTDKDKVISLLSITNCFELRLYVDMRLESHYTELLDCIYGIINKHSNPDLMNQSVSSLNFLTTNELAIRKTGEVARNKLVDEIVTRFVLSSLLRWNLPNPTLVRIRKIVREPNSQIRKLK